MFHRVHCLKNPVIYYHENKQKMSHDSEMHEDVKVYTSSIDLMCVHLEICMTIILHPISQTSAAPNIGGSTQPSCKWQIARTYKVEFQNHLHHSLVPKLPCTGIVKVGRAWYFFSCEDDVITKKPEQKAAFCMFSVCSTLGVYDIHHQHN